MSEASDRTKTLIFQLSRAIPEVTDSKEKKEIEVLMKKMFGTVSKSEGLRSESLESIYQMMASYVLKTYQIKFPPFHVFAKTKHYGKFASGAELIDSWVAAALKTIPKTKEYESGKTGYRVRAIEILTDMLVYHYMSNNIPVLPSTLLGKLENATALYAHFQPGYLESGAFLMSLQTYPKQGMGNL